MRYGFPPTFTALEKISAIGGKRWNYDSQLLSKYVEAIKVLVLRDSILPETVVVVNALLRQAFSSIGSTDMVSDWADRNFGSLCCSGLPETLRLGLHSRSRNLHARILR